MHVVIPFALSDDPACRQAAQALKLPALEQIVKAFSPSPSSLTPPKGMALAHEHVRATHLGLPISAHYPWAALEAGALGMDTTQAWAYVTPCHWLVGQGQVMMGNPHDLQLSPEDVEGLRLAMHTFFAEDGISLHASPGAAHWLACGDIFKHLQTAPAARAIGRNLSPWLPDSDLLRRLQNEMQMLLYTHPINDARSERGALAVNSVWFSGTGALPEGFQAAALPATWQEHDVLQAHALNNRWDHWQAAWQTLDATVLQALLQAAQHGPVTLSLCSEDRVLTLCNTPRHFLQKLKHRLSPQGLNTIWNAL